MSSRPEFKLAIDAREAFLPTGGKARYTAELIRNLILERPDWQFVLYTKSPERLVRELEPLVRPASNYEIIEIRGWPGGKQLWLAWNAWRTGCRAMLAPTGYLPVLFSLIPCWLTVHDLAIWVEPASEPARKTWLAERLLLPMAVNKAQGILAISESTKTDLIKIFKLPASKIVVTLLGYDRERYQVAKTAEQAADDQLRAKRLKLPNYYFLYLGTIEPRKNLPLLLRAYHQLPESIRQEYRLVIGGRKGWNAEPIYQLAEELATKPAPLWLGSVANDDLPALYRLATAFVFPSHYEGFGLPPLEAMACGTPAIVANNSSLIEVVADRQWRFDHRSVDELVTQMTKLTDPKQRALASSAALKAATKFDFAKTAQLSAAAIESGQHQR